MAQYTDTVNNIVYNNVSGGTKVSKLTNGSTDFELEDIVPVINAVEIDWNGVDMGNLTTGEKLIINTTGQLLSYMSSISQKITNLENILINL